MKNLKRKWKTKIRNDRKFRHYGEKLAAEFLEKSGLCILCHNFHGGFSEIDLIAVDRAFNLRIIEVKHWKSGIIHPLESITRHKIKKLHMAYMRFLQEAEEDPNFFLKEIMNQMKHNPVLPSSIRDMNAVFDLIYLDEKGQYVYYQDINDF